MNIAELMDALRAEIARNTDPDAPRRPLLPMPRTWEDAQALHAEDLAEQRRWAS